MIVMQDWEFPSFDNEQGVSLPGLGSSKIKNRFFHVHISGKCTPRSCGALIYCLLSMCYECTACVVFLFSPTAVLIGFNYGIIFMVMIFDSIMLKHVKRYS